MRVLLICLAGLLLWSCAEADPAAQIDKQLELYASYARTNNYFGLASLFAEDGVLAPGVVGPKAIQQQLASNTALKVVEYSIDPEKPAVTGNTATQVVVYQQQVRTAQGNVSQITGRLNIEWVKSASGRWLIAKLTTS